MQQETINNVKTLNMKLVCFKVKNKDNDKWFYYRQSKAMVEELQQEEHLDVVCISKSAYKKVMLDIQKRENYHVSKPKYLPKQTKSRLSSNRKLRKDEVKGKVITFTNV